PDARHDERHARGPALADVVAVHSALLEGLVARVVVLLRVGRQLELTGLRHEPPRAESAVMLPRPGQIERRLWPRLVEIRRCERAKLRTLRRREHARPGSQYRDHELLHCALLTEQ